MSGTDPSSSALSSKKKADKDVNRVTLRLLYYCLKIEDLVIEDLNFLLFLYTWNIVELHFILFIIMQ